MPKLHPKIIELQKRIGATPFVRGDNCTRKAAIEADNRLVKAYHCIFGEVDDRGTLWMKGAFKRSIDERGPKSSAKYKIAVLYMHDIRDPIGLPAVLEETDEGLYAEYEPDDVPSGNRVVTQVRSGTINNFSFGFKPVWEKMEYDSDKDAVIVMEAELLEISPVTIGSNMNTHSVRGLTEENDDFLLEETEEFIRSIPRKQQLELRQLIDRHRLDACSKPTSTTRAGSSIDYKYLLNNLKLKK